MTSTPRALTMAFALILGTALSASAQAKIDDAQIAAIAVDANQVDVDAGKLKVTPKENETSMALTKGGKEERAKLSKLSGDAFDKAYIDNEVGYHETVIKALDDTLIPNAQNGELKSLLTSVRGVAAAHLEHAKQLQSSVK